MAQIDFVMCVCFWGSNPGVLYHWAPALALHLILKSVIHHNRMAIILSGDLNLTVILTLCSCLNLCLWAQIPICKLRRRPFLSCLCLSSFYSDLLCEYIWKGIFTKYIMAYKMAYHIFCIFKFILMVSKELVIGKVFQCY